MKLDIYNLKRFVEAQEDTYNVAISELRAGHKRGHWIWFIFPQYDGLGTSHMSHLYSIKSLPEAIAFVRHPLLGARLAECTVAVISRDTLSTEEILGTVDAKKFRSSMTLFEVAAPDLKVIRTAIEGKCRGTRDSRTLTLLGSA
jgi:uncharacterized protein (DUF1810 family)